MPSRREVSKLPYRWVHFEDFGEAQYDGVLDARVAAAEELPAVIVAVVCDMQYRRVAVGDLPKRDHRAVRWLVERPVVHALPSAAKHQSSADRLSENL